jgi:hypothetical protein
VIRIGVCFEEMLLTLLGRATSIKVDVILNRGVHLSLYRHLAQSLTER